MRRSPKEIQVTKSDEQDAHSVYTERTTAGAEGLGMEAGAELTPVQNRFKRTVKIPFR
ncbi:hypothetical protein [Paenibacillus sp. FJAT-26967]|uniref:hypothetical protein n=1 Tax=Paenibacillus sp. FJAT-26967 TaxID=1729690 RepID=UPI000AB55E54|nr:hypothetical protein [Paenibacillus sp. FJAT-26967]